MSFTQAADYSGGFRRRRSGTDPERRLSIEELRQRAVGRVAIDVPRGLGSRVLGFFGTLVSAHLVTRPTSAN